MSTLDHMLRRWRNVDIVLAGAKIVHGSGQVACVDLVRNLLLEAEVQARVRRVPTIEQ